MTGLEISIGIVLIAMVFGMIEVSIAYLIGYRYKVFLAVILGMNLIPTIPFELYLLGSVDGVTVWHFGFLLVLFILSEYTVLKLIFKKRYEHQELLVLSSIMNIISFFLVLVLRQFI